MVNNVSYIYAVVTDRCKSSSDTEFATAEVGPVHTSPVISLLSDSKHRMIVRKSDLVLCLTRHKIKQEKEGVSMGISDITTTKILKPN